MTVTLGVLMTLSGCRVMYTKRHNPKLVWAFVGYTAVGLYLLVHELVSL